MQIFKLKYSDEKYNLESAIPYSFIKIYLEDKSYLDLVTKFEVIKELNDESEISLKDIIKVLTNKYNIPEKVITKEKDLLPEIKDAPDIILTEVTFKNNIIKADPQKPGLREAEIKKDEVNRIFGPEKIYSEQLLKEDVKQSSPVNNHTLPPPGFDVKNLFNEKHLEKITDKIYNSDLIYRDKSFTKLNQFKSWADSSKHLKDIFKMNNVEIYNKDVINFINILNEFFQNRE